MNRPALFLVLVISLFVLSCDDDKPYQRSYRMGFQNSAPRIDNLDLFIQSLNLWTQRSDAAIISTEVPWEELLAGADPVQYAIDHYRGLVEFYRSKDLELWIYIDPQNGLDRTSDALELLAAGKSIADPEIQLLYRRFTVVMDSLFQPEHLGLALETNLIRDAASTEIYNGVKEAAQGAADDIRLVNPDVELSVSVQVDHAWGKLAGGTYQGIDQDFLDFPFIQELGLSSYPYFGFDDPIEIPTHYYSQLIEGKNIPVFVSEGGWSSESLTASGRTITSSTETQRAYIQHHSILLQKVNAIAVFQLVFTDIDLDALPPDVPDNIQYFAHLGLVDTNLQPKPALTDWDNQFSISLKK